MNTKNPLSDPEAVALSKVYALLIQVGRQHKVIPTKTDESVEIENVQGNATEMPQSRDLANVPLSVTE